MAQGEPIIRIALFDGPRDNDPKPVEVFWDDLVKELSSFKVTECTDPTPEDALRPREGTCIGHHCPHKKIEAWSPADYADDCDARADASVRAITVAVFDLDGKALKPEDSATPERMADLAETIAGLRYVCHATHTIGSYRLIIALSRPVKPEDWPATWNMIRTHYRIPADPSCSNLSRVFFFPSKPYGRGEGEIYIGEGAPLDLDWLGSLYATAKPVPTRPLPPQKPAPLPEPNLPTTTDLQAIRKSLKNLRRPESAELARRILESEPLAREGERDDTVNRAASLLATAPDVPPPADLAVEILKPSISLMPVDPEGLEYWLDKARYSFTRALNRRAAKDARSARLNAAILRGLGGRQTQKTPPLEADVASDANDDSNTIESSDEDDEGEASDAWMEGLLSIEDEDGEISGLRQCGANANLILRHEPNWKNFLAFNEITKDIDLLGGPLVNVPKGSLDVEVANWLARSEFQLILKPAEVGPQLLAVARRNPVNPLKEYLMQCKEKWLTEAKEAGGLATSRLENFFMEHLGARGDPAYLKAISKRWLISCVARGLQPGCFVKTVLVLEGPQGAYKSSVLRVLGGEFFSDTKIDISTKDGRMAMSRFWIVEMSELASMRRADVESMKAFISNVSDDIRLPYGKVLETFPRTSVLVGTTNSDDYLTDPTGNVRYWPVQVGRIDLEGIREIRDLLWGEAVVAYEEGERWWFEPEETDLLQLAEKEARERTRQSPYMEKILEWFLIMPPDRRPQTLSVEDIATRALQLTTDRVTEKVHQDVGVAMGQLGFKKVRRRIDSVPIWRYELPAYMRTLAQESKPKAAHVQVIARVVSNQTAEGRRNIQLPEADKK